MNILKSLVLLMMITSSVFLTGCATVVGDSEYAVSVTSKPANANFEITNSENEVIAGGITPDVVLLPSSDGYFSGAKYFIAFTKDNYDLSTVTLNSNLNGWYFGNLLFGIGGVVIGGLIIDPITGAMWELPTHISGSLIAKEVVHN